MVVNQGWITYGALDIHLVHFYVKSPTSLSPETSPSDVPHNDRVTVPADKPTPALAHPQAPEPSTAIPISLRKFFAYPFPRGFFLRILVSHL